MPGGYVVPPTGPLGEIKRVLEDHDRDISEAGRASGTQTAEALQQIRDLIDGIIAATNISVPGYLQAGTNVIVGADVVMGGNLYTPNGYAFDITYTRRAAWLGNDGRLGYASSSLDKKELIHDVEMPDPLTILEISDAYYVYKAELAKRDDPENPHYDPNYKVHLEYGHIAQWLHEAGLWQAVVYEDGEPIAVHDNVLAGFAIRAAKFVWGEHQKLADRVTALEGQG